MLQPQTNSKEHPKCLQNAGVYFKDYAKNTTVHGIRFVGERKRTRLERIWWFINFGLSVYFSVVVIGKTYRKWKNSPVVVAFATSETPIWKIPFPAVTIFSSFKGDFTKARKGYKKNPSKFSYERYDYLELVCPTKIRRKKNETDTVSDEMMKFLMLVTPYFSLWRCKWASKTCNFPHKDGQFKPTITSEGVCYTFNILDREDIFTSVVDLRHYEYSMVPHQPPSEWSLEEGYTNSSQFNTFPVRTRVSGLQGGLELSFNYEKGFADFVCPRKLGYQVLLHNPVEVPNFNQHHILIGPNLDISAVVKPKMLTTSEELKSYKPKDRNCYFSSEKQLLFFKHYTQAHCLLECQTNFTYSYCGCVNFYMPRTNSTPICGFKKLMCLKEAAKKFTEHEALLEVRQSKNYLNNVDHCNCFPSCYSLNFDTEISQTKYVYLLGSHQYGHFQSDTSNFSRLQIYFKDMQFLTYQRNELYGQTDFLASCGGLLGLFIGFSVISIIELLYYFTLRITCNFWKHGKYNWSGDTKQK